MILEHQDAHQHASAVVTMTLSFLAGLMGNNFLYLLETAKKNVLQPNCAVIPCAASLYVMGISIATGDVAGYDLSGLNTYRCVCVSDFHKYRLHHAALAVDLYTVPYKCCLQLLASM